MEHFIQTLLTMTGTATIAALCVMVLRIPLKKPPRWITCALWLVVFLRMVCPVSLDLPVSLMPAQVTSGAAAERVILSAPAAVEPAPTAQPAENFTPTVSTDPAPGLDRNDVLFAIWAAGAAGMGLWAVASYSRLRRRVADGVLVSENVYETDQVDSPFVCGFFNPRIYLPVGLAQEDKAYVLLHEQAHLRRRDHLTKPLGWLALCVHWFNPVLWISYRLFCRDVETACDQAVVKDFDKAHTAGYAAALLHLGRKPSLPQAVPLAFGEENAKGRIKHVLDYKKPAFWVVILAVFLCLVCGVLLLADRQGITSFEEMKIIQGSLHEPLYLSPVPDSLAWGFVSSTPLPEDLLQELVVILNNHDYEDYQDTAPGDLSTTLILNKVSDISFYTEDESRDYALMLLNDGCYCLARTDFPDETIQVARYPDLADSRDFQDWEASLKEYLYVDLPDQLYALRVDSVKDAGPILDALYVDYIVGPYTLETSPGNLTIQVETPTDQIPIEDQRDQYLGWASLRIMELVGDIDTVIWEYPASESLPEGATWSVSGSKGLATLQQFRDGYNSEKTIFD